MHGKTVVITGATSGVGQAAAEKLASMGARIVAVARDRARGEATVASIRKAGPAVDHAIHYADLSRISEMKRVGREITAAEPRIDVLINNAGAAFNKRRVTEDGLELTFATNHIAYFVLTHALVPSIKAAAPSRIVSTSSMTYAWAKLDLNDLQSEKKFDGMDVYAKSKLANVLFTLELSRRLEGMGVTANCLHPGFVKTRLGSEDGGISNVFGISTSGAISPEDGSRTTVYLASSPEVANVSGRYFSNCREEKLKDDARDMELAKRLWDATERIVGFQW
jgi:NAD(P)-dependent dehydrogenase (short-subunit alcohol dehydrogenase family)